MTVESLAREALIGLGLEEAQISELAYQRREYIKDAGLMDNELWAAELMAGNAVQALKRVQHLVNMDVDEKSLRCVAAQMAVPPPFGDVVAERQRQDAKWGGPEHDDIHYPWEWIDFIAVRTRDLPDPDALRPEEFVIELRQRFVEIAALAVAAIESLDRKIGGQPS